MTPFVLLSFWSWNGKHTWAFWWGASYGKMLHFNTKPFCPFSGNWQLPMSYQEFDASSRMGNVCENQLSPCHFHPALLEDFLLSMRKQLGIQEQKWHLHACRAAVNGSANQCWAIGRKERAEMLNTSFQIGKTSRFWFIASSPSRLMWNSYTTSSLLSFQAWHISISH